jgi:hypothetical protein
MSTDDASTSSHHLPPDPEPKLGKSKIALAFNNLESQPLFVEKLFTDRFIIKKQ